MTKKGLCICGKNVSGIHHIIYTCDVGAYSRMEIACINMVEFSLIPLN